MTQLLGNVNNSAGTNQRKWYGKMQQLSLRIASKPWKPGAAARNLNKMRNDAANPAKVND